MYLADDGRGGSPPGHNDGATTADAEDPPVPSPGYGHDKECTANEVRDVEAVQPELSEPVLTVRHDAGKGFMGVLPRGVEPHHVGRI